MYQPKPAHTQVTQINTKRIVPIVSVTLPSALTAEKLEKKTVISKKTCIMDWLVLISLQLLVGYFVLFLLQLCKVVVNSVWLARLNVRRAHTLMRYYRKKKRKKEKRKKKRRRWKKKGKNS